MKRTPVLGFDGAKYAAARMEIEVRDGVKVPVSLAWKRRSGTDVDETISADIAPPRDAPVLLTGYGSYGVSNDPSFARDFVPLMDRGVVACVAHVRGGGEMGRAWYEAQGKYLRKKNTFRDFVDVASALVANGTTSPEKLAISGAKRGRAARRRLDQPRAAFVQVRGRGGSVRGRDGVHVRRVHPAHHGRVGGVGQPERGGVFPLHALLLADGERPRGARNLRISRETRAARRSENRKNRKRFPAPELLVTSGLHDPRVAYWEGAKYAARMREATTPEARVLPKTDLDAGHFSASDRYKYFKEKALEHAFVLDSLGLSGAKPKWQGE